MPAEFKSIIMSIQFLNIKMKNEAIALIILNVC